MTNTAPLHPLPWQHAQFNVLNQSAEQQRLPHALLLAGPEGVGKRLFAEQLTKGLLCTDTSGIHACGACKSCVLYAAQNHPDVMYLEPEDTGKQIKIEDVRDSTVLMNKTSQQGGAKVLLIGLAEAMNEHATNALLKTLEEPQPDSYLVLLSDAPMRLLPTIRSRCQRYEFDAPSFEQGLRWLKDIGAQISQEGTVRPATDGEITAALGLSSHRPLYAQQLLASGTLGVRQALLNDLSGLIEGRLSFNEMAVRWKQHDFALLIRLLSEVLLAVVKGRLLDESSSDDSALSLFCAKLSKQLDVKRVFLLYEKTLDIQEQGLSKANINKELLLENLSVQCQSCLR
ncbi:MAG: DNA polymerase III subunit delta' [Pseudomonadota bacterium]